MEINEREKYRRMHAIPGYSPGPGISHVQTFRNYIRPGESVIDFGCGTGDAAKVLSDLGHPVWLVDIVQVPLRRRHGLDDRFFEASLHNLSETLPTADWGFCCDVMEHLPEEWVDPALAGMRAHVGSIFFAISGVPDGWGRHIGEVLHLTVRPREWWTAQIVKYWPVMKFIDGEDSYILVYKAAG